MEKFSILGNTKSVFENTNFLKNFYTELMANNKYVRTIESKTTKKDEFSRKCSK
jgi:hypothetical protein